MIKSILKLIRFEHGLMLSLAVLVSIFLTGGYDFDIYLLGLLAIPFLVEAGSFALNDYLDVETDRLNKKDRPIVKGEISKELAMGITFASFFLAVMISMFYDPIIINITGAFAVISILYNYKLKDLPLIGNLYIGMSMGIPFIFGNLAYSNGLVFENVILFVLALIIGTSREIVKTVEDYDGDKQARNSKTLPYYLGKKGSLLFSAILNIIFVVVGIYSFTVIAFSYVSGILWGFSILYYLIIVYPLVTGNVCFKAVRRDTLITMLLGLVALLLTKFAF